ncbi:MAG: DUF6804 family protein [Microbacteriaceae bacterium]
MAQNRNPQNRNQSNRYPDKSLPAFTRPGLVPGFIGMIALMIGAGGLDQDWMPAVLYVVSIFALINLVFAYQAKHWWWWPILLGIAVLWNPIYPIEMRLPSFELWLVLNIGAGILMAASGMMIKVPTHDAGNSTPPKNHNNRR